MSLATALVFMWAALLPQGQRSTQPTTNAASERAVRQLIESLPPKSMWRNMLEHGARGDGIRRPWMDEMQKQGIKFAVFTFEFKWTQGGRVLKDWTFVSATYFADYDYLRSHPIMDPNRLDTLNASGLEDMLRAEALARGKDGIWVELPGDQHPALTTGMGYKQVFLADNEWLPVQLFPWYAQYEPGTTPLMRAAIQGDVARIRKLLAEGADVNALSPDGLTALLYAAGGKSLEAAQILLVAGANVSRATNHGATPLMTASGSGNLRMVNVLLKAGANPNARDADGHTALWIAAQSSNWEIVKILKQAGAQE